MWEGEKEKGMDAPPEHPERMPGQGDGLVGRPGAEAASEKNSSALVYCQALSKARNGLRRIKNQDLQT